MRFSVIIPSRDIENLSACLAAVYRHEPGADVVVVSDGLGRYPVQLPHETLLTIEGVQPFVYARNVNMGIRTARAMYRSDAYILLNDDALLTTPGGFTRLLQSAAEHPDFGVIGAVTNCVGNIRQYHQNVGFREEHQMVCFVCALITARCVDEVGLLDERFVAYGWEDNDYCRRARLAGFRIGIEDRCFVDHASLKSSFRGDPARSTDIGPGAAIYHQKWGDFQ